MCALHSRNEPMVVYSDRDLIKTPVEAIIPRGLHYYFYLVKDFFKNYQYIRYEAFSISNLKMMCFIFMFGVCVPGK